MDKQQIKYWLSEVEYDSRPDGVEGSAMSTSMENLYPAVKHFYPFSAFEIVSDVNAASRAMHILISRSDDVLNITGNPLSGEPTSDGSKSKEWEWWVTVSPWNNSDLEVARWAAKSSHSLHKALVLLLLCASCYPTAQTYPDNAVPMFLDWSV